MVRVKNYETGSEFVHLCRENCGLLFFWTQCSICYYTDRLQFYKMLYSVFYVCCS